MKKILFVLLAFPSLALSQYRGQLDLSSNPSAIGLRELHDGNWLAGVQQPVASLWKDQKELVHLSFFTAWRAMRGDPAYGPSLGLNMGKVSEALGNAVAILAPDAANKYPYLSQLGNWVSLETYGGYRPVHGPDVHSWVYGVGGKVTIPLDLVKGL